MKRLFILIIFVFILSGCSKAPWIIKCEPSIQKIEKPFYTIQLIPFSQDYYYYTAFKLVIENNTDNDIDLIWDKTYYLQNGQTSGGFMFEGIFYRDKNNSIRSDVIFPNQVFEKIIYPSILAEYNEGWYHAPMPNGENGIYISLTYKNAESREKLTAEIFAGYDESQRKKTVIGNMIQKISEE